MELAQPADAYFLVEDSSCHLVLRVQDCEGGNLRELPVVVIPYPLARNLHEQLGQYLARQQVFDREFRNQSGG